MRNSTILDAIINQIDGMLRTLNPPLQRASERPSPAAELTETALSQKEKQHIAGLMRVNHAGEVCAQALYQGQAVTARLDHIRDKMNQAAAEETDHLAWCETRLRELHSAPSILNPLWYAGSFLIGAFAGLAGDGISLGFVAETERQVSLHLQKHLKGIPKRDKKTQAILQRMQEDEEYHANMAINAGAKDLPKGIKKIMSQVSSIMTKSSYYL